MENEKIAYHLENTRLYRIYGITENRLLSGLPQVRPLSGTFKRSENARKRVRFRCSCKMVDGEQMTKISDSKHDGILIAVSIHWLKIRQQIAVCRLRKTKCASISAITSLCLCHLHWFFSLSVVRLVPFRPEL